MTPWERLRAEIDSGAKLLGGAPTLGDHERVETLREFLQGVVAGQPWPMAANAVGYSDRQARRVLDVNKDWLADQGVTIET